MKAFRIAQKPQTTTKRRGIWELDNPTNKSKPRGTGSCLHLPSIAVVIRVTVSQRQNLQKEPAKRQGSSCVAAGLPEELHTFAMRGLESCLTAVSKGRGWEVGYNSPCSLASCLGRGWARELGNEQNVTL